MEPLDRRRRPDPERKMLLNLLEDRYGVSPTVVTSQVEPDR